MNLAASAACKFPARVQELDGALYLVGGDNGISWARLRKRVGRARLALLIEMDQLARSLDGEFTGFNPDDEWASGGKLPMGMPASDDASDEESESSWPLGY